MAAVVVVMVVCRNKKVKELINQIFFLILLNIFLKKKIWCTKKENWSKRQLRLSTYQ